MQRIRIAVVLDPSYFFRMEMDPHQIGDHITYAYARDTMIVLENLGFNGVSNHHMPLAPEGRPWK
jgi:hypothetical protein